MYRGGRTEPRVRAARQWRPLLRGGLYRDLFHPVIAGAIRDDVFVWDHEDDSRTWFAADVEDAVRRWMANEAR